MNNKNYTIGSIITEDGNSLNLKTGDWRNAYPVHKKDACKNCMLCVPYCPEDCILHTDDAILLGMDLDYCKGCGICATVCPFDAIEMVQEA
ncbi:Pyruvate synthase subunit PorD [compost metagenome]